MIKGSCLALSRTKKEAWLKFATRVIQTIKASAKTRGIKFQIMREEYPEVFKIFKKKCYYCGDSPSSSSDDHVRRSSGGRFFFTYSGLDRVNSKRGYLLSNVVPCCKSCNIMKLEKSQKAFYAHIRKILTRRKLALHKD